MTDHNHEPGKKCGACKQHKPLSSYPRNAASPDDRKSVCLVCEKARVPKTAAERQAAKDRRRLPRNRVDFKRCRGCHRVQPAGEFNHSPRTLDALVTRCKSCERQRYQERKARNLRRRKAEQAADRGAS